MSVDHAWSHRPALQINRPRAGSDQVTHITIVAYGQDPVTSHSDS
jgi:hypothetical protein